MTRAPGKVKKKEIKSHLSKKNESNLAPQFVRFKDDQHEVDSAINLELKKSKTTKCGGCRYKRQGNMHRLGCQYRKQKIQPTCPQIPCNEVRTSSPIANLSSGRDFQPSVNETESLPEANTNLKPINFEDKIPKTKCGACRSGNPIDTHRLDCKIRKLQISRNEVQTSAPNADLNTGINLQSNRTETVSQPNTNLRPINFEEKIPQKKCGACRSGNPINTHRLDCKYREPIRSQFSHNEVQTSPPSSNLHSGIDLQSNKTDIKSQDDSNLKAEPIEIHHDQILNQIPEKEDCKNSDNRQEENQNISLCVPSYEFQVMINTKKKLKDEMSLRQVEKFEKIAKKDDQKCKIIKEKQIPKLKCIVCDQEGHTSFECQMICKNCSQPYHNLRTCPKPVNISIVLQQFIEFSMKQCYQYDPNEKFLLIDSDSNLSKISKKRRRKNHCSKEKPNDSDSSIDSIIELKKKKRKKSKKSITQYPNVIPFPSNLPFTAFTGHTAAAYNPYNLPFSPMMPTAYNSKVGLLPSHL